MPDVFSPWKRSEVMSKIRSKETKCEVRLRRALREAGALGYRKNVRILEFEVDVAFPRKKVAVFCDSDFWHGLKKRLPKTNKPYWKNKLMRNRKRDLSATRKLRGGGWRVIRLREHDILKDPDRAASRVLKMLEA